MFRRCAHEQRVLGAATPVAALLLLATAAGAAPAPAGDEAGASDRWLSLGILTGSTQLDAGLADYQWEMGPHAAWGVQALAGSGRFAAGLRVWNTQTTQQINAAGASASPQVRLASAELVGHARLATVWGTQLLAMVSVGGMHLGYHPDQVTLEPSGSGVPITVDLEPVNEWIAGGGVAVRRPLSAAWAASVEVDARVFALDTAHRNGSAIELERTRFGDWSARLELAWLYRRR